MNKSLKIFSRPHFNPFLRKQFSTLVHESSNELNFSHVFLKTCILTPIVSPRAVAEEEGAGGVPGP